MIHLRPLPNHPAYIAALEKLRSEIIQDLRRDKARKLAANDNKREARLIQKQNYIQQGGS